MMRWHTRLRPLVAAFDAAGVIGLGLVVFAAAMYFSAVMPARQQLAQLEAQAAQRQRAGGLPDDHLRTAAMRGAEQLEQFNRKFPPLADAPALVLKLHDIATQNGIGLDTGEYQLIRDNDTGFARYQVTLPLRGTYWQARLFVAQLLDEMPASVLDEISMKRESVGARAVETRVRVTIYLAPDGGRAR
jgi:Tfp pilus assembly protein PilO